jgi:hypothetical protein
MNDSGAVEEISEKSEKKWPKGKVRDGEGSYTKNKDERVRVVALDRYRR